MSEMCFVVNVLTATATGWYILLFGIIVVLNKQTEPAKLIV